MQRGDRDLPDIRLPMLSSKKSESPKMKPIVEVATALNANSCTAAPTLLP